MKNILIISASPRKEGNTNLLCDEFLKGAKSAGHSVEKIWLPEQNINYCTGCCDCIGSQDRCSQKDGMNAILDKFLAANIIVLASPVYFHMMDGQMKTFIDRICPIYSLARNKEFYYILASAGGRTEIDRAFDSLKTFTDCLPGSIEKDIISVSGIWDAGGVKGTQSMKNAYNAGINA